MKRVIESVVLAATVLIFTGSAHGQGAPAAGGNTANGRAVFLKQGCFRCHGTDGQGGAGPKLAPNTIAAAALVAYVRKPTGQMPPYAAKFVSDSDLNDVRAYLATVPAPPAVKDNPLLNQ